MRSILKLSIVALLAFLLQVNPLSAQKGKKHGHHNHHNNGKTVMVVKNKPYHHYHKKVYHPVWRPYHGYYRRWVYFPHYNFYWDNYSNMYVYWGGGVWMRTANPPPVIINVNLSKEKHYELKESDDEIDDIYGGNANHKKDYPEN
ncbi:MAG TPA: hypothetical protein VGF30_01845 [Bacteroidia bacterium]